jgi:hypothetical protein
VKNTLPSARQRNVRIMRVSLLVTASYWWLVHHAIASAHAQSPHGYEGEGAFIIVVPLYLLLLYAGFFSLVALERLLRRHHEPMPKADLLLGLLPLWLWPLWLLGLAL